jgi:DNA mismatch repair protein MutS2
MTHDPDISKSPAPRSRDALQQALQALEWPRILDLLAARAHSANGAERCRAIRLETELEAARARLDETAELLALEEAGEPVPSLSFPDVRDALGRVEKAAILETHVLRDISTMLAVGVSMHRFIARRRDAAPALAAAAAGLAQLQRLADLKEALDRSVDPDGNIRESATPELRRLFQHAHDLKQTMRRRLEVILASKRYAEVLQEQYSAQREGRYVVPLKAEMRSRIPGIVHDVSASGATVFLEPRELVELNNSIKVAELAVQREIAHILQQLSVRVAEEVSALRVGTDTLAELDCIAAKAAFSRLVKGRKIALNATGRIALRKARHPLLVLAREAPEAVVANDIVMEQNVQVLIISGPNTGGKTVTLKILGLSAVMVRAGLLPPCEADSEMPLFREVYADIGDTQDLARDLSSFSAHMTQMIRMISLMADAPQRAVAEEDSPGTPHALGLPPKALVLLDELATSTDPAEGAALAEALLKRMAALGLKVVVTTHYNSLKALAQTTPGFLNASVEFDVASLSPTYRLLQGLPGGSSALEIAGRLGMEPGILQQARALLQKDDRAFEQLLGELHEKRRILDQDTERARALRAEAERATRDAAEIAERLRVTERDEHKRIKRKLTDELMRARAEVQRALDELKRDRTLPKTKEVKQRVAEIESQVARTLAGPANSIPVDELGPGAQVEIDRFGSIATLLESPRGKKRVRVRIGHTEMSVAISDLTGRAKASHANRPTPREANPIVETELTRSRERPLAAEADVVDVRGRATEEALDLVVSALDRAALLGAPTVRIIHGHGTGRLKAVLREYLGRSEYVAAFRPGERAEGGDGVTVVQLR